MNKKLKLFSLAAIVAGALGASSSAFADGEVLTGDTRLACEAILCLSSGTKPGECGPSLQRYFSISYRKWSDTVKGRRNFLNLCPTAHDTSSANMPQIVENIVNGAGRCDANTLNATLRQVVQKKACPSDSFQNPTDGGHWVDDSAGQ
ncbi:TrbM/KikA/MpfK family conjugal transfer protein [Xanthomonas phaseoli]|uniref:TrbM/KikA/MpfK family conjugal transfer protein n=1 Tax=Xanthomonas phaseoli TaxID=1985254 RepID=UPI0002FBEE39|nr:TrbM/KikA/MpfK family conjugal transfer protein [Xanthomonas phaseoli]